MIRNRQRGYRRSGSPTRKAPRYVHMRSWGVESRDRHRKLLVLRAAGLSSTEPDLVFGGTARRVYSIPRGTA